MDMPGSPPKTRRCDSSTTRSPTVAAKSSPAPARLSRREKLLAFARKGNVVVVWKLDRLGRSLRDLIDVVNSLQDRGVGLRSLQEAIDTTTPASKLTFHIFAALAEFERDMIRERTRAGLAAAHKRGVAIGRPLTLTPGQISSWPRRRRPTQPSQHVRWRSSWVSPARRSIGTSWLARNAPLSVQNRTNLPDTLNCANGNPGQQLSYLTDRTVSFRPSHLAWSRSCICGGHWAFHTATRSRVRRLSLRPALLLLLCRDSSSRSAPLWGLAAVSLFWLPIEFDWLPALPVPPLDGYDFSQGVGVLAAFY